MIAPVACYFPYTDIAPAVLSRALLFFQEIILYRLPQDQPDTYLAEAADRGLVRLVEADFFDDPSEVERILAQYTEWAGLHAGGGDLTSLRDFLTEDRTEATPSALMTSIRRGGESGGPPKDPRRSAQVFMHFARRLDAQMTEIDRLLSDVADREKRLGDVMGVESGGDDAAESEELMPGPLLLGASPVGDGIDGAEAFRLGPVARGAWAGRMAFVDGPARRRGRTGPQPGPIPPSGRYRSGGP